MQNYQWGKHGPADNMYSYANPFMAEPSQAGETES